MIGRKTVARGVGAQQSEPLWLGIRDQESQYASAGWTVADPPLLVWLEPDSDELGKGVPFVVEHAEGTVAGVGHRAGLIDNVAKQGRQVEVGLEQQGGLQYATKLDWIVYRAVRHEGLQ